MNSAERYRARGEEMLAEWDSDIVSHHDQAREAMLHTPHTPTPWARQGNRVWDPSTAGCTIAEFNCDSETTDGKDRTVMTLAQGWSNAAFATKAVNCHDDLVEAVALMLREFGNQRLDIRKDFSKLVSLEAARKAIAKTTVEDTP